MKDSQSRIAVCNQKGSIGKSTFTGYLPAIGISIPIVDWRGGASGPQKAVYSDGSDQQNTGNENTQGSPSGDLHGLAYFHLRR